MSEETFWVVWQPESGPPSRRHASEDAACNEAKRLARSAPDKPFYVLHAIGVAEVQRVVFRELHNPIPF